MTYSLAFTLAAVDDIIDSIQWYNNEKKGLGFEFFLAVDEKLKLLINNPLHFPVRFSTIRTSKEEF